MSDEFPKEFDGTYFSKPKFFANSQEFSSVYFFAGFGKEKAIIAKIIYNPKLGWEEMRIFAEKKSKDVYIPYECSIYATKTLGARWKLIRSFDCDHAKFKFRKEGETKIVMSPDLNLEFEIEYFQKYKPDKKNIYSIIINKLDKKSYAWSIALRYAKKDSVVKFMDDTSYRLKLIERVDSTALVEEENYSILKPGDILSFELPPAKGIAE
jgi:hypothetical protein